MTMTGLQIYTDERKQDAFVVVRKRFSDAACRIVEKYLHNPMLSDGGAGDVAYENDRPVGFQAAIRRRLYLDRQPLWGMIGGMLCMLEGASPVLLMNLLKASIASRDGSTLFYANTSNQMSMKMNRMLGVKGKGPSTCERTRFAVTFVPWGLRWMCPRPHARRIDEIDDATFGRFWVSYLSSSHGLVSSRSPEELRWVFGDRLRSGEVVLLGEFRQGALVGYIVLKVNANGRRWSIIDWIALDNDTSVLNSLLMSAVRFVRKETHAFCLESIGFPEWCENILRRHLCFSRKAKNNTFIWKFLDGRREIAVESWFFGPYDGDRCM